MGPGSILFHATLTAWGGLFDQFSMYLLLGFMVSYNVIRIAPPQAARTVFLCIFGGMVAAGLLIAGPAGDAGTYIFIATGIGVGLFEVGVFCWFLPPGVRRDPQKFWLGAIGTLAVAIAFWLASNPEVAGPPTEFPFHVFWHLISGAFLVAYFYYLRSEQPKAS